MADKALMGLDDAVETDDWQPPGGGSTKIVFLVMGLLAAGAVAFFVVTSKTIVDPRPVVVAVEIVHADGSRDAWWDGGGERSIALAEAFGEQLSDLGMKPIHPRWADVTEKLAAAGPVPDPAALGAAVDARWVLAGRVRVEAMTPLPLKPEIKEVRLTSELALVSVPDGARTVIVPGPSRLVTAQRGERRGLTMAGDRLLRHARAPLIDALAEHPEVAPWKEVVDGLEEEEAIEAALEPLFRKAHGLMDARARRTKAEKTMLELDADAGLDDAHRLGPYFGEEYLVGLGPGETALTKLEEREILYQPDSPRPNYESRDELLVLVDLQSGQRDTIMETGNIFGFPGVSRDGRLAAMVLSHFNWSRTLTVIDLPAGEPRHLLESETYFSGPNPAPDGSKLTFWHSETNGGADGLEVIGADGSGRRVLVEAGSFRRMTLPSWAPDAAAIYVAALFNDDTRYSIHRYDVQTGERTPLVGAAVDPAVTSHFNDVYAAPDNTRLAVSERTAGREDHLGFYDLESGTYTRWKALDVEDLAWSDDSTRVALVLENLGDTLTRDIAVYDVAKGEVILTIATAYDDRSPRFSRDGSRLFYHHGDHDPTWPSEWTNRVYWAELTK